MDLDEMLRVDRCWDMDEPVNFLSPIRIIVRMLEPDCFLRYRISAATGNFTSGKSHRRRAATASRGFKMFYLLSRRNTFVRGKCALPSAF